MMSTIAARAGGAELLQQCWDQIEQDCIQVATAMLCREAKAEAAKRAGQEEQPNAPAAPEGVEEESDDEADPFGAWSPSKRQAVPSNADGAVPATMSERVRRLVESELKAWRADVHPDNFVKAPLLHRKKKNKFKLLNWWLKRKNIYAILMIVAISYHIALASAARPERTFSWCGTINTAKRNRLKPRKLARYVFLKRNKKFWPTKKQVVDEYLRRRAAGEWHDMGFERVSRDLYRLCA